MPKAGDSACVERNQPHAAYAQRQRFARDLLASAEQGGAAERPGVCTAMALIVGKMSRLISGHNLSATHSEPKGSGAWAVGPLMA